MTMMKMGKVGLGIEWGGWKREKRTTVTTTTTKAHKRRFENV